MIFSVSEMLCSLMNRSLKEGIFLNICKISKIIPLHKSGNIKDMNNYRSISIFPIMSKILEKLIYKHLMKFLTIHNLLSDKQFGFRKNHSTVDVLVGIQK
jgi:hypothetical protein